MSKSYRKKYLYLILYLISFLVFYNFPLKDVLKNSFILDFLPIGSREVEAMQATIDNTVTTTDNAFQKGPKLVFTSGFTGYAFGVDGDSTCAYWKTTNGGMSWGTATPIWTNPTCAGTTIWYDRWTPGDTTGNYIHITFATTTSSGTSGATGKGLYYERLDTSDDSQLGEVAVTSTPGTIGTSNSYSITKATNGTIYLGTSDTTAGGSFIFKCSSNCGNSVNWSQAGSNPMDAAEDIIKLRPLASNDIMLINDDISANLVRSKVYTMTTDSWDVSWSNIATATDSSVQLDSFEITLNKANNNLYLSLCTNVSSGGEIISGIYDGSSWSTSTAKIYTASEVTGVRSCAIGYDEDDNIIYAGYVDNGGGAFFKTSTTTMASWSGSTTIVSNTAYGGFSFDLYNNNLINAIHGNNSFNKGLFSEPISENLIQTSYRWQNDDNPPNSNTNMTTNATTSISNVKIGQRLTSIIQVTNTGNINTSTALALQFTTDDPTSGSAVWTTLSTSTAISTASSPPIPAGVLNSGSAITSQKTGVPTTSSELSWRNGEWWEETAYTTSTALNANKYTEVAYVIDTHNASANTTYYLRLYNQGTNRTLTSYQYYPTLTAVMTDNNSRYSFDYKTLTNSTSSLYYFDDLQYTRSSSSDDQYASTTNVYQVGGSLRNVFMFIQKNTNNTDQLTISWEGKSDVACNSGLGVSDTASTTLEVFNFNTLSWQFLTANTTAATSTDFTVTSTISTNISNYYDSNNWTYWRVSQRKYNSNSKLYTDYISITFTNPYQLHQTSYRWQNDDSPPNSNTNMAVATTTITDVKVGQRLTAVIQLENTSAAATTTIYVLQYCTGAASAQACSSWINLATSTALSTASSPSSTNSGASITSAVGGTPTSTASWVNGLWFEQTATSSSFTLNNDSYTELAFLIDTHNAVTSTTYYLRLYNNSRNTTLDSYYFYPTLTIISSDQSYRYFKGENTTLTNLSPTSTPSYLMYLDDLGYSNSTSSNNAYDSITANSSYPMFLFAKQHTNSTDNISLSFEGQSDTSCSSQNIIIQIYNFTTDAWETLATNTSCSAGTDFTSTASISSSQSSYYNNNWAYFLVYQDTGSATLKTDYLSFTFTTPTPAAPSSGTTSSPGGSGLPATIYNPPVPPPTGFSLIINNNASYTNTLSVTLTLTGGEDTQEMAISNDPSFTNIGLEPYQTTKSWNLCPGIAGGNNPCNLTLGLQATSYTFQVYAKYYTQYGQSSEVVSDNIIYSLTATLEQISPPTTQPTINLTTYQYLRNTTSQANFLFNNYVSGMILLRVENHGEAYYVLPDTNQVYYLKDGEVAYQIMSQTSLGINEKDYTTLRAKTNPGEALRRRLGGKIVLRAHSHGEAYYINPYTLVVTYLKDGPAAYELMRKQSLGITDENLRKLIAVE